MIRVLRDRVKAGVDVRVVGKVEAGHGLSAEPYPGKRQHLRLCDGTDARPSSAARACASWSSTRGGKSV